MSVTRTHHRAHGSQSQSLFPSPEREAFVRCRRFLVGFSAFPVSARAQEPSASEPDSGGPSTSRVFSELQLNEKLFRALRFRKASPTRYRSQRVPVRIAAGTNETPSLPAHTGFKALVFDTASDFAAFPRRPSTWVILAISRSRRDHRSPVRRRSERPSGGIRCGRPFFAPGKYIGAVYTQAGLAVGFYLVGRYLMPRADGAPNQQGVSLGFDMLRSIIVSQVITQGMKNTVRRNRPTGECCAFPSGHSSTAFATASALERHADIAVRGPHSSSRPTSPCHACTTTGIT